MLTYRNLIFSEVNLISGLILSPFGTDYSLYHNYVESGSTVDHFTARITNFPLVGLIKHRGAKGDVLLGLIYGTRLDEVGDSASVNHFGNYDAKGRYFYIEGLITESGSTDLGTKVSLLKEIKKQAFAIERVFVGIGTGSNGLVIVNSVVELLYE
jgi:hypothetical protein